MASLVTICIDIKNIYIWSTFLMMIKYWVDFWYYKMTVHVWIIGKEMKNKWDPVNMLRVTCTQKNKFTYRYRCHNAISFSVGQK